MTVMEEGVSAEIGVLGGSGFYNFFEDARRVAVKTPYGEPSDMFTIAEVGGRSVAFLPRHGRGHHLPPQSINYRANLWALHSLGVNRVLAPCAVGSLRSGLHPGDFVICDQFVDRTHGRADTFFDGPEVVHIGGADPYCPELRALAHDVVRQHDIRAEPAGTVVVVQGPRFSTRAESRWFAAAGWDVVNMTQYPEVILARELGMCYLNISLVTDYDIGVDNHPVVEVAEVVRVLASNVERVREVLFDLIPVIPEARTCPCVDAVDRGRL
jgi:5'-methylthioadenosine phosphorylase